MTESSVSQDPTDLAPEFPQTPASKHCPSCHGQTESWAHVCPCCGLDFDAYQGKELRFWNPMAAALWSLLFSPIFGALLLQTNWEHLGRKEENRWTWLIAIACVAAMAIGIVSLFFETSSQMDQVISGLSRMIGIVGTAGCFSIARRQKALLSERYPNGYPKKSWGKPLAVGSGLIGLFVFSYIAYAVFSPPDMDIVAKATTTSMSEFFQRSPQYLVTGVRNVVIKSHQGHDYEGEAELIAGGVIIRRHVHVHASTFQIRWEIPPQ